MRILLIEENLTLANLIDAYLSKFYILDEVSNVRNARYFLDTKSYDLLIIDLSYIDQKDPELYHFLKKHSIDLIILFLNTGLTIQQKVDCLQLGTDYLIKPFSASELAAKVENLLRLRYCSQVKRLKEFNLELDKISHKAYADGKEVVLNRKEYALLELFLYHPQQIFSKAMLAEKIWQEDKVLLGNTIETTMAHLRKKIGKDSIKTIKGVGYAIH